MKIHSSIYILPLLSWACFAIGEDIRNIPISKLGERYQLIGKLNVPLGQVVKVTGVAVFEEGKGYEVGPNIYVQKVNNIATQKDIKICIEPYNKDWGKTYEDKDGFELPKLEMGKTYVMEGYESGSYVGVPGDVYKKAGIMLQTSGFYFMEKLIVYKAKKVESVVFSPADFPGRKALFPGRAASINGQSLVIGKDWSVVVNGKSPWPEDIEGKLIETYGIYQPVITQTSKRIYKLVGGTWRLTELSDQIGRKVALRGRAVDHNNKWLFMYRGTDIYVENMEKLPGWSVDHHWRPVIIKGILEKARLPQLDQDSLKPNQDLKEYYIIRQASWEPLGELMAPEINIPDKD